MALRLTGEQVAVPEVNREDRWISRIAAHAENALNEVPGRRLPLAGKPKVFSDGEPRAKLCGGNR